MLPSLEACKMLLSLDVCSEYVLGLHDFYQATGPLQTLLRFRKNRDEFTMFRTHLRILCSRYAKCVLSFFRQRLEQWLLGRWQDAAAHPAQRKVAVPMLVAVMIAEVASTVAYATSAAERLDAPKNRQHSVPVTTTASGAPAVRYRLSDDQVRYPMMHAEETTTAPGDAPAPANTPRGSTATADHVSSGSVPTVSPPDYATPFPPGRAEVAPTPPPMDF